MHGSHSPNRGMSQVLSLFPTILPFSPQAESHCNSQRPVTNPALVSLAQNGERHIQPEGLSLCGSTTSVSSANESSHFHQLPDGYILYLLRNPEAIF